MRYAVIMLAALLVVRPTAATTGDVDAGASLGAVQRWIYNYRAKPDPVHVPAAVRVLFKAQTFKDPENAGIYLGFIAGAIGANPARAEQLVDSLFPLPPEDEWVIVRAIAYSGLPDWKNLLSHVAPRMPGPQPSLPPVQAPVLGIWSDADHYLDGERMRQSAAWVAGPWRYAEIAGASHWVPRDASGQLNDLLLDWLR